MDSTTRFFIAVPMKKIDSVSVAEALIKQFSIFGTPKTIHCDHRSNLSSEMLQELWRMYGSKMQHCSVYKKMTVEQPKLWHRYIDPLLFTMRSVPNSSGYSPFELMFGRRCRTHMSILRVVDWAGPRARSEDNVSVCPGFERED